MRLSRYLLLLFVLIYNFSLVFSFIHTNSQLILNLALNLQKSKNGIHQVIQHNTSFQSLGIFEKYSKVLNDLNYIHPTHVQRKVIPKILNNENICMAAVTG